MVVDWVIIWNGTVEERLLLETLKFDVGLLHVMVFVIIFAQLQFILVSIKNAWLDKLPLLCVFPSPVAARPASLQ
jgi:hypothetical protein